MCHKSRITPLFSYSLVLLRIHFARLSPPEPEAEPPPQLAGRLASENTVPRFSGSERLEI